MINMLIKFWPALIPVALYVVWMLWRRRKARKSGTLPPSWTDGRGLWVACVSLLTIVGCFVWFALQSESNSGEHYQPARLENGTLIDGTLN